MMKYVIDKYVKIVLLCVDYFCVVGDRVIVR